MATTLRSLLSRFKSISRPSLSGSSSYSSVAKKQISAEDAIIDDQYDQGNLSAESYLSKLQDRLGRAGNTPLQVQNLTEKIRNVQTDVTDAEYSNAYQRGQITSKDMYDYEKAKLDKMTEPGSQAYIKQEQKVNGLLDKSEREARSNARTAKMLEISQMPEDSSQRTWEKYSLYDQLEQQARLDGDASQADQLAIQKNNYYSAAKRADINDLITGTKLQTSETFGAGIGVPTAESGQALYSELTGSKVGIISPTVKNALESLDRQKKSLDRLYQSKDDKNAMVSTYESAVAAATGDQKTQLTIALNNLKSDIVSLDNQIANTTQNITDTVYKIQDVNAKAAVSGFKQELRKKLAEATKKETEIEQKFQHGEINKIDYIASAIQTAELKGSLYEQASNGFAQFGDDENAQKYLDETNKALDLHEGLISYAQNIDDYEPVMVDKDSNLTNIHGDKLRKGDVVLSDVRDLKMSGRWNENYANVDGVFHRIKYEAKYLDKDGYLMSGLSNSSAANILQNAYVDTVKDGRVVPERVRFLKSPEGIKAVTETEAQKLLDSQSAIQNQKGELIVKPNTPVKNLMKSAEDIKSFVQGVVPGYKQYTNTSPQSLNIVDYYKKNLAPIVEKGVAGAKNIFQQGKEFATTAINKAKDIFRGMNIFNPPAVSGKEEVQNPYAREIAAAFGNEAGNAQRVLRYADESGQIKGENTNFQTGTEVDIPNRDGSIDRGLFRINSNTFADFMRRKGQTLAKYGIRSWDDMLNPQKNALMAKVIKDEQGWGAWYAAPEDLRAGQEAAIPASQHTRDLRTENIELALGLPKGTYKKGAQVDQAAIDKAYRSNDQNMIKLMQEEGFNPSATPTPIATPRPSTVNGQPISQDSNWSIPKIELPKINIPQITSNIGQAAQKASTAIKSYFNPTSNAGQNFWSTPVASGLANVQRAVQNVTQPVVNKVSQAVNTAKNWVSNLFKKK